MDNSKCRTSYINTPNIQFSTYTPTTDVNSCGCASGSSCGSCSDSKCRPSYINAPVIQTSNYNPNTDVYDCANSSGGGAGSTGFTGFTGITGPTGPSSSGGGINISTTIATGSFVFTDISNNAVFNNDILLWNGTSISSTVHGLSISLTDQVNIFTYNSQKRNKKRLKNYACKKICILAK